VSVASRFVGERHVQAFLNLRLRPIPEVDTPRTQTCNQDTPFHSPDMEFIGPTSSLYCSRKSAPLSVV